MNGKELQAMRQANRYTQRSLAKALGVSKFCVIAWENRFKLREIPESMANLVRLTIKADRGKFAEGLNAQGLNAEG